MSKACSVENGMAVCNAGVDSREAFRLAAEKETDKAYSPGQAVRVAAGAVQEGYSAAANKWRGGIDRFDEWAGSDWSWYLYPLKPHVKMASFILNGNHTVITKGVDAAVGLASLPFQYVDNVEEARGDGVPNPFMTGGLMLAKDMGIGMYEQAERTVKNLAGAPIDLAGGDVGSASVKWSGALFDIGMLVLGAAGVVGATDVLMRRIEDTRPDLAARIDAGLERAAKMRRGEK